MPTLMTPLPIRLALFWLVGWHVALQNDESVLIWLGFAVLWLGATLLLDGAFRARAMPLLISVALVLALVLGLNLLGSQDPYTGFLRAAKAATIITLAVLLLTLPVKALILEAVAYDRLLKTLKFSRLRMPLVTAYIVLVLGLQWSLATAEKFINSLKRLKMFGISSIPLSRWPLALATALIATLIRLKAATGDIQAVINALGLSIQQANIPNRQLLIAFSAGTTAHIFWLVLPLLIQQITH